ncbi:hypothetical protein [Enterovirga aerilata]|uniref:Uncharacterized protein n=1 Tax=Enterovirga aerilata TaxID=2730920 RepID=A0A849I427_9HYPH|nr:hypothetical protein [Enterovirga sp. DB1703]NNM72414.1 hypothetical protein [Enterovirga sp. DB1703]
MFSYSTSTPKGNPSVAFSTSILTGIGAGNVPIIGTENEGLQVEARGTSATEILLAGQVLDPFTTGSDHDPAANDPYIGLGLSPTPRPKSKRRKRRSRRVRTRDNKRIRKVSLEMSKDDAVAVEDGFEHATRIGRPLNAFLTIRPAANDNLTVEDRFRSWKSTYNALCQCCRDGGFKLTAIYARESKPDTDGQGDHWHLQMHIPDDEAWQRVELAMGRRFPGVNEVDLRPIDQEVRWSEIGAIPYKACTYLTKACSKRKRQLGHFYQRSGPVYGARSGMTTDINAKAIRAWDARRERLRDEMPMAA